MKTRRAASCCPAGQGVVGGLGAGGVDRVGDAARPPVAAQGQRAGPRGTARWPPSPATSAAAPRCPARPGPLRAARRSPPRLARAPRRRPASAAGPVIASRNSASLIGPTVNGPASSAAVSAGKATRRPRNPPVPPPPPAPGRLRRTRRAGGGGAQRGDEGPRAASTSGAEVSGEHLLELVDDQDQPAQRRPRHRPAHRSAPGPSARITGRIDQIGASTGALDEPTGKPGRPRRGVRPAASQAPAVEPGSV